MEASDDQQAWFLKSSCPVLIPAHDALTKSQADFDAFIADELKSRHDAVTPEADVQTTTEKLPDATESETITLVSDSTAAEIRRDLAALEVDSAMEVDTPEMAPGTQAHPFMRGLVSHQAKASQAGPDRDMENKMFTENADVAHRSTTNDLVDLFYELEDVVSGPRLIELLDRAWVVDPLATLKIIFNARSIHLGKSSRNTFYRADGWLAQRHPLTFVANLRWLSRPVIEKKAKKEGEDDIVLVEEEPDENDPSRFDVQYGVSHGYWKDMLNILALAVNGKLNPLSDPRDVLNSDNPGILRGKSIFKIPGSGADKKRRAEKIRSRNRETAEVRSTTRSLGDGTRGSGRGGRGGLARGGGTRGGLTAASETRHPTARPPKAEDPKKERRETRERRHKAAVEAFNNDSTYRALHLTVARLFAEQLQADVKALRGSDAKAKKGISLCGKWAPSHDHFHDKHTFVVSSIAEIMYPRESLSLSPTDDRETYLRYAREEYRKDTSALRKHLEIVERELTANTYGNIKYNRLPSLAMRNYSKLFLENDLDRFEKYIENVAEGKAKISGATLLPSTLISGIRANKHHAWQMSKEPLARMSPAAMIEHKTKMIEMRTVDGQWKALVQRIKDSGKLSSSIAVCDVSGSMGGPRFPDGTCPMDSAIGLSLLVAEVTQKPFGGAFITFSSNPTVQRVDLTASIMEKVMSLERAHWEMSTNFVAVFEKLILPMAIANKLKQEDMVKRIFVFSDMQFNQANNRDTWSTSFERIQKMYAEAGYEMPELIFWNLAGGRAGYNGQGDPIAPKPVTTTDEGTSLVSGYSQGMLKVFLDSGSFEAEEEESEDEVVVTKEDDGTVTETVPMKKAKKDPLTTVKKAIGHKAYDMMKVLD